MAGNVVLSTPRWRQDYGYYYGGDYVVSADWQLGFQAASLFGLLFGGFLTGVFAKRFGNQVCIGAGYVLTVAGVFCQWYSPGKMYLFLLGKLLTGVPLGMFLTVAPTYCSDVAPPALRGALIASVNVAINFGLLIGYRVQREVQAIDGANAYPFLAVERQMRPTRAILRLYGADTVETKFTEIQALLNADIATAKESGSFKDCFNAQNRLRTLIALSVFFIQTNSDVMWFVGYMGYFFQLSGMEGLAVFDATVGISGLMTVGSMLSWYFVERLGRRWTILGGLLTCTLSLFLIAMLAVFIDKSTAIVKAQVAFMAIWSFSYQCSVGSTGYTLMAEIPTSSLRGVTRSRATIVNALTNSIWAFSLPYMINPDQAAMGGKVAFVFFALLLLADIFVFFYYPDTKGRSFEELDELFTRKISPRMFAETRLQ